MSEAKKIKELRAKLKELERLNYQKQIEIEFKEKMIEIASEVYGIDIKKRYGSKLSRGSGSAEKSADGN